MPGTWSNRIRNGLAEWNRAGHLEKFELSLSIGVAEWAEGKTLDDLLDGADHQMYAAKEDQKAKQGQSGWSLNLSHRFHIPTVTLSGAKCFACETFAESKGPYELTRLRAWQGSLDLISRAPARLDPRSG